MTAFFIEIDQSKILLVGRTLSLSSTPSIVRLVEIVRPIGEGGPKRAGDDPDRATPEVRDQGGNEDSSERRSQRNTIDSSSTDSRLGRDRRREDLD